MLSLPDAWVLSQRPFDVVCACMWSHEVSKAKQSPVDGRQRPVGTQISKDWWALRYQGGDHVSVFKFANQDSKVLTILIGGFGCGMAISS